MTWSWLITEYSELFEDFVAEEERVRPPTKMGRNDDSRAPLPFFCIYSIIAS